MQFMSWVVYTYIVVSHWYCWPCNLNSSSIPNNWNCQHTHLSSSLLYLLPEYWSTSCLSAVSHRRRTWKVREDFLENGYAHTSWAWGSSRSSGSVSCTAALCNLLHVNGVHICSNDDSLPDARISPTSTLVVASRAASFLSVDFRSISGTSSFKVGMPVCSVNIIQVNR